MGREGRALSSSRPFAFGEFPPRTTRCRNPTVNNEEALWNQVRLTGWYERYDYDGSILPHMLDERAGPVEHFCVLGPVKLRYQFPLDRIKPIEGARILPVPKDKDPDAFALEAGGFHAVGRREPVERKSLGDLFDEVGSLGSLATLLRATVPYYCEHGRSIAGTCGSCEPIEDEDEEPEE